MHRDPPRSGRTALAAVSCALFLGLTGCLAATTSAAKLTDAAFELNDATRFGRMDIACQHVPQAAREEFGARHAAWGKGIRIVDLDFGGINMRKEGAQLDVTITWQRPDEMSIRTTVLSQHWSQTRGDWNLTEEEETSGDKGLLVAIAKKPKPGDKVEKGDKPKDGAADKPSEAAAPPPPPQDEAAKARNRAHYQTRVIYDE